MAPNPEPLKPYTLKALVGGSAQTVTAMLEVASSLARATGTEASSGFLEGSGFRALWF